MRALRGRRAPGWIVVDGLGRRFRSFSGVWQNLATFRWNEAKIKAAILVAEDDLSNQEIAASVGVTRQTLDNWKTHPDFAAQVAHHIEDLNRAMTRLDIAKKRKRVAQLDTLAKKLWQIVEERATDYVAQAAAKGEGDQAAALVRELFGGEDVPAGGGTGLVTKTIKQIGTGRAAQIINEFGVATDIVRTIMALHEQAAKELGQWTDQVNVTGGIKREYVIVREDKPALVVGEGR